MEALDLLALTANVKSLKELNGKLQYENVCLKGELKAAKHKILNCRTRQETLMEELKAARQKILNCTEETLKQELKAARQEILNCTEEILKLRSHVKKNEE